MMATPRFITDSPIPGINEPSVINYLASDTQPTAGDHLEPKHFTVWHGPDNAVKDRDRAPALSRRQKMRMGEDQQ